MAKLPMRTYYGKKDRIVPADRGDMIMKAIGKAGGKKAELIERLLGPGEIEDELDCDVPMAVTAMSPTVLIEACKS